MNPASGRWLLSTLHATAHCVMKANARAGEITQAALAHSLLKTPSAVRLRSILPACFPHKVREVEMAKKGRVAVGATLLLVLGILVAGCDNSSNKNNTQITYQYQSPSSTGGTLLMADWEF